MSMTCLGCGGSKPGDNICCDDCWNRIPTNLPGFDRWRSTLRTSRRLGGYSWHRVEAIHNQIRTWLAAHNATKQPGRK